MLKSKTENIAYSFIMGITNEIEEKLNKLNCIYEKENDKYYLTCIPKKNLMEYEKMITNSLEPGFWNEYISDKVIFIFKTKTDDILRYEWNTENEKEILGLCNLYASFNKESIEEMLLSEPFYKENSIEI